MTKTDNIVTFTHNMGDAVKLPKSGEQGEVIGQAKFKNGPDQYLVCYKSGNGCQVSEWWSDHQVEAA